MTNKIFLSTQSKALLRSNKTAQTAFPWSKDNVVFTNSDKAKVVESPSLNPNSGEFKILNNVKKNYEQLYMVFSVVLLMFDKSEIDC